MEIANNNEYAVCMATELLSEQVFISSFTTTI